MSYIGNQVTSVPFVIDTFSGTGTNEFFGPMVRAPAGVASIAVYVSGVYKTPGIDYIVQAEYITFTTPPALGTNNIVVHHLGNGVMATQVPADGAVTSSKLAIGAITGNTVGLNALSANNFSTSANLKIFSSGLVGSIIFGG